MSDAKPDKITKSFGVGPIVDFAVAQYSHTEIESGGASVGGDVANATLHYWLALGVRIVVLP
jgi:hypothetical protein